MRLKYQAQLLGMFAAVIFAVAVGTYFAGSMHQGKSAFVDGKVDSCHQMNLQVVSLEVGDFLVDADENIFSVRAPSGLGLEGLVVQQLGHEPFALVPEMLLDPYDLCRFVGVVRESDSNYDGVSRKYQKQEILAIDFPHYYGESEVSKQGAVTHGSPHSFSKVFQKVF